MKITELTTIPNIKLLNETVFIESKNDEGKIVFVIGQIKEVYLDGFDVLEIGNSNPVFYSIEKFDPSKGKPEYKMYELLRKYDEYEF